MTQSVLFESARLKLDRAQRHVNDLYATLDRYSRSARIDFEPDGSFVTVTIEGEAEPKCSLIIGDAIHNLRAALDHAFWELMKIDGGVQDRYTSFPVHLGNRTDYIATCKGIRTPRNDTKDFFIGIEAFPDGAGEVLSNLHGLDITDKHSLLTPVFGLTSLCNCVIIRPDGQREDWDAIGVPYTREILNSAGTAIIQPFREGRFEPNEKTKAALDIMFGDIESAVQLEPVRTVLDAFWFEVSDTISNMERFILGRH